MISITKCLSVCLSEFVFVSVSVRECRLASSSACAVVLYLCEGECVEVFSATWLGWIFQGPGPQPQIWLRDIVETACREGLSSTKTTRSDAIMAQKRDVTLCSLDGAERPAGFGTFRVYLWIHTTLLLSIQRWRWKVTTPHIVTRLACSVLIAGNILM